MQNRIQTLLLIAILLLSGASGSLGIILLEYRPTPKAPLVLMLRPGHAPVEWQGWQLTPPPASRDCAQNGFDRCSDGQTDDDVIDNTADNVPMPI